MIYHGTIPITSMFIGSTPIVSMIKENEQVVVNTETNANFITADNNTIITADNNTFLVKEE